MRTGFADFRKYVPGQRHLTPVVSVISLLVIAFTAGSGYTSLKHRFEFETEQVAENIRQRFKSYELALRGGLGIYRAVPLVTREIWARYVASLELEQGFKGVQGVGYTRMMRPSEVSRWQQWMRSAGEPGFRVFPEVSAEPVRSAILWLEPRNWRNDRAIGYDMLSEPTRRAAMLHAMDYDKPVLSGAVTLVQEVSQDVQKGFILYLPHYRFENAPPGIAERRAQIEGFVVASFRSRDFLEGVIPAEYHSIALRVYDHGSYAPSNLMAEFDPFRTGFDNFLTLRLPFRFGEHDWGLEFSTPVTFFESGIHWLLLELLLAVFLVILVHGWTKNFLSLRQLREREQQSEAELSMRTNLFASINHEIRTPLAGIVSNIDYLATEDMPEPVRRRIHSLRETADHLNTIINDLLDFSRMKSGGFSLSPGIFHLRRLLIDAANFFRPGCAAKGLYLNVNVDKALDTTFLGDAVRLRQIIFNFLSNAQKYTKTGGITLNATLRNGRIRIEVIDTGEGISRQSQTTLFTEYIRHNRNAGRGTGLGLYISRQLAEAMGGKIGVDSQLLRGSGFWLELKLPAVQPGEAVDTGESGTQPASASGKILIVEDDPVLLEVAGAMFRKLGFAYDVAETGAEAILKSANGNFDLFLIDYHLPDIRGDEVAAALRSSEKLKAGARIYCITAGDHVENIAEFDKVILKPLRFEEIQGFFAAASASGGSSGGKSR